MTYIAVWVVSILSLMTASMAVQANMDILVSKRELQYFQARTDYQSAIMVLVQRIQNDPFPHEDTKRKEWYGKVDLDQSLSERISVRVEDEESKLDLNSASADQISALILEMEDRSGAFEGTKRDYVKGILKLRYEKELQSLEELLTLDVSKSADLERLRSYTTVYSSSPQINVNTASMLVMSALVQTLNGDHASKVLIKRRFEEVCGTDGCDFRQDDLQPDRFADILKLPKTPLVMQAVQDLVAKLTVDSETFKATIENRNGGSAVAIFRSRAGQFRPEVLYWHEN